MHDLPDTDCTYAARTSSQGGWTALIRAAADGQADIVELLASRGAALEAKDRASRKRPHTVEPAGSATSPWPHRSPVAAQCRYNAAASPPRSVAVLVRLAPASSTA